MPKGVHNGKRGPKPRGPIQAAELRRQARNRANRKWNAKRRAALRSARPGPGQTPRRPIPAGAIGAATARAAGLSIVRTLNMGNLSYLDEHGHIHREDFRSAEQLIADFQHEQRRKRT